MPFTHEDRKPGDRVRSADWNAVGREVLRLDAVKVSREGDTITGALAVRGDLSLGAVTQGAALRVLRGAEDGSAPTHGAVVLGSGAPDAATLRLGLGVDHSWLQGQGRQTLAINPRGGDVGVGTAGPRSRLSVAGGVMVGAGWAAAVPAPVSSLIVEGSVGIGTPTPAARLHVAGPMLVNGDATLTANATVSGSLRFGNQNRQMLNLWGVEHGAGVQSATTYFRSSNHFGWFRGGVHSDLELNAGGGVPLMALRATGELGIGTVTPGHRLEVQGGDNLALLQSTGATASLRLGTAEGVANRVELANRPGGRLALWVGGAGDAVNVLRDGRTGIGTPDPQDRLEVRGGLRILTDSNPVRFTSAWSGFPDAVLNQSEISNDTGGHKKLMIIGNKSGGGNLRRVGVWDRLDVHGSMGVTGVITPSAGNGEGAGLLFPPDVGGGINDRAWLRYYSRGGEAMTLELGISNETDDHIALMTSGGVGIGTTTPQDRLEVRGGLRILTDGNPVRFTSAWSGFPDAVLNQSEISNDTGGHKKLMIIGNKSGGGNLRRVGVWDELAVHGQLIVDQDIRMGASRTLSAPGRLHITGDELLYVLNRNGMMIGKEWGGTGTLQVQGTIGTNGLPATPIHAGWGGGIRTFDIEAEGTIWCRHSVIANGADLAENYACGPEVEPADVVCLHPDHDAVVRSERAHDGLVLGVVSTAPGVVLNADLQGEVRPIALSGRVPCKVTDENGPIRRGDLLTSSSTPGHAMRAEPAGESAYRPGTIVGKALGSLEAGAGTIEVFVLLR